MAVFSRTYRRPRRRVSPVFLEVARYSGLFRRDDYRSAWVLRLVGRRVGPALVRREPVLGREPR
jgi:hypothetical protein